MLGYFYEDAIEQLDLMESALLDASDGTQDQETVGAIFRAMHTIKGTAGMFEFNDIVSFTHVAENLLDEMTHQAPLARDTIFGEGFAHDMDDLNDYESTLLYRWVISGDWKLILSYDGKNESYQQYHKVDRQGPRLYKVSTDEYEQVNLAKQHPEIVARLSQKLVDWYPLQKRKILQK